MMDWRPGSRGRCCSQIYGGCRVLPEPLPEARHSSGCAEKLDSGFTSGQEASIFWSYRSATSAPLAQLDRASVYGTEG